MDPYEPFSKAIQELHKSKGTTMNGMDHLLSNHNRVNMSNGINSVHVPKGSTWVQEYEKRWERSDQIFTLIDPRYIYMQPISLRLPIIFYMGHLPCFMWSQFKLLSFIHRFNESTVIHPYYDEFFQRGVDPSVTTGVVTHTHSSPFTMKKQKISNEPNDNDQHECDAMDGSDNHDDINQSSSASNEFKWERGIPLTSVKQYETDIRTRILSILPYIDREWSSLSWSDKELIYLALEHECMHQETLLYMLIQMPLYTFNQHTSKAYQQQYELMQREVLKTQSTKPLKTTWIDMMDQSNGKKNEITVQLGQEYGSAFGWDNEFPPVNIKLHTPHIQMMNHPVTNGEFLAFVKAGGYHTARYWHPQVYEWIQAQQIHYPAQWNAVPVNGINGVNANTPASTSASDKHISYTVNFMFTRNVPIDNVYQHPVMCSQVEAIAYCKWYSEEYGVACYLPSEAEWVYMMHDSEQQPIRKVIEEIKRNDGYSEHTYGGNFRRWYTQNMECSERDKQLYWDGSVWEWTRSKFAPFPHYTGGLRSYPNYSNDFFDDTHYVILGSSWATDSILLRRTFRNWYQKDYRYMFAGFRMTREKPCDEIHHSPQHHQHVLNESYVENGINGNGKHMEMNGVDVETHMLDESKTQQQRDRHEIITGLTQPPGQKYISSQYFYDDTGSQLYTKITELPEYYLFNAELQLLNKSASSIKQHMMTSMTMSMGVNKQEMIEVKDDKEVKEVVNYNPSNNKKIRFIELGCGDGQKVNAWLSPFLNDSSTSNKIIYQPSDISSEAVNHLMLRLSHDWGHEVVKHVVQPFVGTFHDTIANIGKHMGHNRDENEVRCVQFLGSSIGNLSSYYNNIPFHPQSPALQLLTFIQQQLHANDWFLCAFDLCKFPIDMIIKAYNDSSNVTASFNYNLLVRFNREYHLNFNVKNYQHYATYNAKEKCMESYLIGKKKHTITNHYDMEFTVEEFEPIKTEVSTKYTTNDIEMLMKSSGFQIVERYLCEEYQYCMVLCQPIHT